MENLQITANEEYLNNLQKIYHSAQNKLKSIIFNFEAYKRSIASSYEGHASNEIVPLISSKYSEHLELLSLCYDMLLANVVSAKERLSEADADAASSINSSGKEG